MQVQNVVLLVEDEPPIRLSMQDTLEEAGYTVIAAVSGLDALSVLRDSAQGLQALVTDIRAGRGPNGWQLARIVRNMIEDIPVVYVSGDSQPYWKAEGVPNSIMIGKPFPDDQLISALARLLQG